MHRSIEQATDKLTLFCTAFDKTLHFQLNIYTLFKGRIGKAIVFVTHLIFIYTMFFISSLILIKSMQNFEENVFKTGASLLHFLLSIIEQRQHFFFWNFHINYSMQPTWSWLANAWVHISFPVTICGWNIFECAVTLKHAFAKLLYRKPCLNSICIRNKMLYSVGKLIRVMIELHPWIFQLTRKYLNNTCNSL